MINTTEVKYFDGQSSASQQATVEFDEKTKQFRLHFAPGIVEVWEWNDLQFDHYGSLLEVRNKRNSVTLLKIDDKIFSKKVYDVLKQDDRMDIHTRITNLGFSKIMAIAIFLLGLIVLAYLYVLPPVAEKSVILLPESFDDEIGDIFMSSFLDEKEIDTIKTKYLEEFAAQLNLNNKKPLRFTVIKSDEVNAFALPNGDILVFSAILNNMQTPKELVALIGHEASHINQRHSTKMFCRNLAGYMLVSLLFSDVNGIMAVLAENAHQLQSLSYSRGFEQEADQEGLKILMDNMIDADGMVKLFEQLEKESKFSIPKIISTHPFTSERIENVKKIISQVDYEVKPNHQLDIIFKNIKS